MRRAADCASRCLASLPLLTPLSTAQLPSHYQPLKPIGKGAYGIVCSAVDTSTGEKVAVKRISGAFDNTVDAKRTLREIMLLRQLRHENIIAIKASDTRHRVERQDIHQLVWRRRSLPLCPLPLQDVMRPPGAQAFTDLYVVYELADTDLHQVIRSNQPLSGALSCINPPLRLFHPHPHQMTTSSTSCTRSCVASSTSTARMCCTGT